MLWAPGAEGGWVERVEPTAVLERRVRPVTDRRMGGAEEWG